MIIAFINTNLDGLNCFAYGAAMSEHYELDICYFMIDNNYCRFINDLNDYSPLLKKQFVSAQRNGKVFLYEESMLSAVNNKFHGINDVEAIVFASSFLKKFGYLRIFQNISKLPIPLLNIKVNSVFTPLKSIFKEEDLYLLESNTELVNNLKANFNIGPEKLISINNLDYTTEVLNFEKSKNKSKENSLLTTAEEIASNILLDQFRIMNKNNLIHVKKIIPRDILKLNYKFNIILNFN